jgi:type VI secretion system secreted protein VgrG
MAEYSQANRAFRMNTVLGADELMLASFQGVETVSRPFHFDVKMVSLKPDIEPEDLLGTKATLSFHDHESGDELRHIHGMFGSFTQVGRIGDLTSYEGQLVPWLYKLNLSRDCRIFQNKSVIDFVQQVFEEEKFSVSQHFVFRTRGNYKPIEFVVQYRETNLQFISRWLEREGLYYYFEHESDKHLMVITDKSSAAPACPPPDVAFMRARVAYGQEAVTSVSWQKSVHSGKVTLKDYDYLQPSLSLEVELGDDGKGEIYEYPGGFNTPEDGERYAVLMLEAEEAQRHVINGEGSVRTMVAGHTFELKDHTRAEANDRYMLLEVKHEGANGDYHSASDSEFTYKNNFLAIPQKVPYRPRQLTRKPTVRGMQTAVVVGPAGEEIYTDKHSRIKIQFHWDRQGKRDEKSSCWVRVASPWGGKGWGSVTIPRIGNEVLVDFLEGDPDRPIVVGSVYNAEQVPPFELPGKGIQMGLKSRSSKGGGGYNEISVNDTKGKELITIHGQFDMNTVIEHDRTETIGNDESISIGGNRTETVEKDESIAIGGSRTEEVDGDEKITIGGSRTESVDGNEGVSISGNRNLSVEKNEIIEIKQDRTTTITKKENLSVADKRDVEIAKDDKLQVGKNFVLNAGDQIQLKTGEASITMKKDGTIEIKGKDIKITASGKINAKASSDVVIKGSQIKEN